MSFFSDYDLRDRIRAALASIDLQILRDIDVGASFVTVRVRPHELAEVSTLLAEDGASDLAAISSVDAGYEAATEDSGTGLQNRPPRLLTLRIGDGLRNR